MAWIETIEAAMERVFEAAMERVFPEAHSLVQVVRRGDSRISPVTYVSARRGSAHRNNHSQGGSDHRAAAASDPPADGGGSSDGDAHNEGAHEEDEDDETADGDAHHAGPREGNGRPIHTTPPTPRLGREGQQPHHAEDDESGRTTVRDGNCGDSNVHLDAFLEAVLG